MILAGTNLGRVYGLTIIKKEMDYIYVDTGRKYLTVAINRKRVVAKQEKRNKLTLRKSSSQASIDRLGNKSFSEMSVNHGQQKVTQLCC